MTIKTLCTAGLLAVAMAPAAWAVTLDFDTLGNGAPSSAGNLDGDEFAAFNVLVSSDKQLALFDSNCGPDGSNTCNSVGTDSDLATGPSFGSDNEGNVLIINGGSDANPNDDASGGTISFDFQAPVTFSSLRLLDLDEAGLFNRITFSFSRVDGSTTVFSGNGDLAGITTLLNPGFSGDNSVRDIRFDLADVTGLDVQFRNVSGAIASVDYAPIPLPAGLPLLAAGLGGLALLRRFTAKA